jgi:serine/threonine-protein kinase
LGVAVDAAGNVYVVGGSNMVVKMAAGSATQAVLPFTGLHDNPSVAVDAARNVYVTDRGNNRVVKLPAG